MLSNLLPIRIEVDKLIVRFIGKLSSKQSIELFRELKFDKKEVFKSMLSMLNDLCDKKYPLCLDKNLHSSLVIGKEFP